jgi:uncharacterized membrane protein HdeD (DUF308 family)
MNAETDKGVGQAVSGVDVVAQAGRLQQEFQHLKSQWVWLFVFGILLAVCGTAAVVSPGLTALTTLAVPVVLGVVLTVAGIATIITSIWAGKWSGVLVQLLVGILYVVVGWMITDAPLQMAMTLTLFVAALFIIAGLFRIVAAMVIRFPYWGWALLNGIISFTLGVVIYRHFPQSAIWVLGLLVGLEMLFHGWTWIMLSLAIRRLPDRAA